MMLFKFLYSFSRFLPSSAVLMFHHVEDTPKIVKSGCCLSNERFTKIIERIKHSATVYETVKNPSAGRVALTFDDGLADVFEIVYPYLKSLNIPFAVFIATCLLDTPGYITTEQLRQLAADPLVTVGAHGVSHDILAGMDYEQQKMEIESSKEYLEQIIGKPVKIFAFSHGKYDDITLTLMNNFDYGMTVGGMVLNFITARDKRRIPRLNIDNSTYDGVVKKLERLKLL